MKTFLKILGVIAGVFIILILALKMYFTDQRLKAMVLPKVDEAIGRNVQIDHLSLTFFETFPHFGLSMKGLVVPGEHQDTLVSLKELVVGVKLLPLISKEVDISNVDLIGPKFVYKVDRKGGTNLDQLMKKFSSGEQSSETGSSGGGAPAINVNRFVIKDAHFGYVNLQDTSEYLVENMNANISLHYASQIDSKLNVDIGGLTIEMHGKRFIKNLPLSVNQESVVDMDKQTVDLTGGGLSIRGLSLELKGKISNWGKNEPDVNLNFSSSSDNFGALLKLVPEEFKKQVQGLETHGKLNLSGNVTGQVGGKELPHFRMKLAVENGYVKNPELPEPVKNIQINLDANNDLVQLTKFSAEAGTNTISATGRMAKPLDDNAKFNVKVKGNVDLGTVEKFYSLKSMDVESMKGLLNLDATAEGTRNAPEKAKFNANIQIKNGYLKYAKANKPFEDINLLVDANQNNVNIKQFNLKAAGNTVSVEGNITHPMDEKNRGFDVKADVKADLATIKEFYPIGDTLQLRGLLTANTTLKGRANDLTHINANGDVKLNNGYIKYKRIAKPIENITIDSRIAGNRINIRKVYLKSGTNTMSASGVVTNYLSKNPLINMKVNTGLNLAEINDYYSLKKYVNELNGHMKANLTVDGAVKDLQKMKFVGGVNLQNVNVAADSMPQPIKNMNASLQFSQSVAKLNNLKLKLGKTDIAIDGKLNNYMAMTQKVTKQLKPATLSGNYYSHYVDMDEWMPKTSETTVDTTAIPVHLPYLYSTLNAKIDSLMIKGIPVTNIRAEFKTTPKMVMMPKAGLDIFDGQITGAFVWDVTKPLATHLDFEGKLDSLDAKSFFKEYRILGKKNKFYKYITGKFSAKTTYQTDLDKTLSPVIKSTDAQGVFGTKGVHLDGSPMQHQLAKLFRDSSFVNIVIDDWKANYTIKDGILTLKNMQLTSKDIGMKMEGTQNLMDDRIDYDVTIYLPPRFEKGLASVLSTDGVKALTQKNGTIEVPLAFKGTVDKPKIAVNKKEVDRILKKYLKDVLKNKLKKLFH